MKAENFLFPVILYFVGISIFEWIFGKFFWSFDDFLILLKQKEFFSAIFLILVIYCSSLVLIIGMMETASKEDKVAVIIIGIILFLMAGGDIYNITQIKDFDDAFGTFVEIIVTGSYTEILQFIAVVHGFLWH